MNERLGKLHFGLTLVGAYGTFFPMHFAGLAGEPRHYSQLTGTVPQLVQLIPLQRGITWSAILLASSQLLFLVNILWSILRGKAASRNPWEATTLEWMDATQITPTGSLTSLAMSASKGVRIIVNRGPYEYGLRPDGSDFIMQCDTGRKAE